MPEPESYLSETVRLVDSLHVSFFHYERIDGDQGSYERTTVHLASCGDYEKACLTLGGKDSTRAVISTGIRYEALAPKDVLIQHMCFPHLPCHGGKR